MLGNASAPRTPPSQHANRRAQVLEHPLLIGQVLRVGNLPRTAHSKGRESEGIEKQHLRSRHIDQAWCTKTTPGDSALDLQLTAIIAGGQLSSTVLKTQPLRALRC